jgi:hypothetical protein
MEEAAKNARFVDTSGSHQMVERALRVRPEGHKLSLGKHGKLVRKAFFDHAPHEGADRHAAVTGVVARLLQDRIAQGGRVMRTARGAAEELERGRKAEEPM